jgi:hypothetical protein
MLPDCYLNYFQPCPFTREFADSAPYQMMPNYNMGGQIPMQANQPAQQQPVQQQPTAFPSNFEQAPGSPTELGTAYTQGYLKTQIGKRMRITFLLGTNLLQDRQGTLEEVGVSYIIIKDIDTTTSTLCDIYAIKFVTIYP